MRDPFVIAGMQVRAGTRKDVKLRISEQVTSTPVFIPVTVFHGPVPGPRAFVIAAVHGDEINGVEMIRRVRAGLDPRRVRGTIILVPIANTISFMMRQRDLPDGRDLNRSFPGRQRGSMASMVASALFRKIVAGSDFGIDIHTAALGRTNYPQVRGDLRISGVRRLARAFGNEVIIHMRGGEGMLRRAATARGIPTIVYEAGEPLKFQERLVERGVRGIRNVLREMGMTSGARPRTRFQIVVRERTWIRARRGGILILKVRPGDIIEKGTVIA